MGFYHPAILVKDAQHHGTDVLPIDATRSGRLCRTERLKGPWPKHLPRPGPAVVTPSLAVRLGLRFVRGLRASTADAIEREQARAPFAGVKDLAHRADLREDELSALAHAGAFATLPDAATGVRGLSRRTALWQAASAARDLGPLYDTLEDETGMCQAILRPDLFRENRALVVGSPALVVEGRLQKKDGTLSIRAERFERMSLEEPSRTRLIHG